ncbi:MAG: hypothetical protein LBU44_06905 [Mediterranea sp.]|jgi:hypothetical protein|nr:hypothetical protein [Mediterranea sp.]
MKKRLVLLIGVLPIVFAGCSKDDDTDVISLKVSEKTLYFEDKYQIEATSEAAINYTVENEYHAKVSETGLVAARFVGETNVLLSNGKDTKNFKVIVRPKSNLYPEPDVKFGDSKSSIIAKFGTPDSETSSAIAYADYSNTAPVLMFAFDSANKLDSYILMVKSMYSSTLADFLLERYLAVSEKDGLFLFINGLNTTTATMAIGLQLYNTSFWSVTYIPSTSTSTKSALLKSSNNTTDTNAFDELLRQLQ